MPTYSHSSVKEDPSVFYLYLAEMLQNAVLGVGVVSLSNGGGIGNSFRERSSITSAFAVC